jgi:hypothetical protein
MDHFLAGVGLGGIVSALAGAKEVCLPLLFTAHISCPETDTVRRSPLRTIPRHPYSIPSRQTSQRTYPLLSSPAQPSTATNGAAQPRPSSPRARTVIPVSSQPTAYGCRGSTRASPSRCCTSLPRRPRRVYYVSPASTRVAQK